MLLGKTNKFNSTINVEIKQYMKHDLEISRKASEIEPNQSYIYQGFDEDENGMA